MSNLLTRILLAVVAIPIVVNIILWGEIGVVIFVSILTAIGFYEFMKITQTQIRLFPQVALFVWLVFANWLVYFFGESMLLYSILVGFLITTFSAVFRKDAALASSRVVFTFFGVMYVSLFNYFILIREFELLKYLNYRQAATWILFVFAVIWICDTAAYFLGATFGKHKMSPVISPNKSWEGFIAGLVFGCVAAWVFHFFGLKDISVLNLVAMAFVISLVGQLGDFVESIFKRRFGVKDSSNIIPGHGGVLDRFDSLLYALPATYYMLVLFIYRVD